MPFQITCTFYSIIYLSNSYFTLIYDKCYILHCYQCLFLGLYGIHSSSSRWDGSKSFITSFVILYWEYTPSKKRESNVLIKKYNTPVCTFGDSVKQYTTSTYTVWHLFPILYISIICIYFFVSHFFDINVFIRKGNMQVIAAHLKHKENIQQNKLWRTETVKFSSEAPKQEKNNKKQQ